MTGANNEFSITGDFPANITFTNHAGQKAVIDFGGESVSYSGDLPVEESARIFFDQVGHLLRAREK